MHRFLIACVFLALASHAGRAAESVGAQYENETKLTGKVVDVLCELTGSCSKACGDGHRVLGLKTADNTVYLIAKCTPIFAGANESVIPFCGKDIDVDGLLIKNPKMTLLFIQKYREAGVGDWKDADGFDAAWKAKNGEADEWFRKDPVVVEQISKNGPLGIPGLQPKN